MNKMNKILISNLNVIPSFFKFFAMLRMIEYFSSLSRVFKILTAHYPAQLLRVPFNNALTCRLQIGNLCFRVPFRYLL